MERKQNSFMMRLAGFVVDRRGWFLALFAALIVFSAFSVRWISVEEDITYYLPDDAEAKRGLFLMEEEFTTYGSARVMVKKISPKDAQTLAEQLAAVEDVVLVQYDESESHYRDNKALYDLTFADTASSERSARALERVKELLRGREVTLYSEVGYSLSKLLAEQMLTVLIFVVIVVLAVLVFTSSTYAEIPVMILTFVTAAVINIGTHFLMGTISFVSNSVGIVLQLALSVDYAIIFCNRYKEEHETLDVRDAAVRALAVSIPEISASSLTTIAGLTAMTLMKFRLGMDLGLTLIKAILCSLLTVFFFMPALLLLFGRAMDRTKHRRFVPKISFVGRFAYATRFVVPILLVPLVAAGYLGYRQSHYAYNMEQVPAFRRTEMERADDEIRETFGGSNTVALIVPAGNMGAEKALLEELSARPEVKSATGLATIPAVGGRCLGDEVNEADFAEIAGVDEREARALLAYYAAENGEHRDRRDDPEGYRAPLLELFLFLHDRIEAGDVELEDSQREMVDGLYDQLRLVREQLTSENYSRLLLDLNLPVQGEETFRFLDEIHRMAGRRYDSGVVLTGNSVSALGFRDSFASDNMVVSLLSIALVMLILFFTFRSFGMPLLLIMVIQGSIWLNFAIAAWKGDYVFFLCYLIVGAIQMGANIDYAIVVSSRYREKRETMDKREAVIETLNLAFPTIITSGLMMVCAGLLVGFGVSQCIIAGMGYYVGTGTSISLVLILFALPQVLLLGDSFVSATTLRGGQSRLLSFLARRRAVLAGLLLCGACAFVCFAAPKALRSGEELQRVSRERVGTLLGQTAQLRATAEKLEREGKDLDALKYDFALQLVTDEIGTAELEEGERLFREGEAQYNSGLEAYNEGAAKLEEAEKQYKAGLAQIWEAQETYDAGLAAYNEGKEQVEAARQQLAEGEAAYEAGQAAYAAGLLQLAAGQAAYDTVEQGYNMAKAALEASAPLYQRAMGLEQTVAQLQSAYDEAAAQGDYAQAMALLTRLNAARGALQALPGGVEGLSAQYAEAQNRLAEAEGQLAEARQALEAGYAEAEEGERQLREAEQQLNEGRAQLADAEQQLADAEQKLEYGEKALSNGYARLYEAKRQIDEGRKELEEAHEQLLAGSSELDENRVKLEEGREMLRDNLEDLNESLAALDALSDDEERLRQGLKLLRAEKGVKALLPVLPDAFAVISAAEDYGSGLLREAEEENAAARHLLLPLAAALLLCCAALLLSLLRGKTALPAAIMSAAAALLSLGVFVLWRGRCAMLEALLPYAALALTVCAALFSECLFRKSRE